MKLSDGNLLANEVDVELNVLGTATKNKITRHVHNGNIAVVGHGGARNGSCRSPNNW